MIIFKEMAASLNDAPHKNKKYFRTLSTVYLLPLQYTNSENLNTGLARYVVSAGKKQVSQFWAHRKEIELLFLGEK